MAHTGRPVPERFPPCGHFDSDGTIADGDEDDDLGVPIFHLSKSLTDMATDYQCREGAAGHGPDLRKCVSSAVCQRGEPETVRTPERAERGVSVVPAAVATVHHLPRGHLPQTASSSRDLRGERLDQALQRSHSVSLYAAREAHCRGPGYGGEAGFTCPGMGCCARPVLACHVLGCQRAAAPLHSNPVPTCSGGGYWSPAAPRRGVWICAPSPNSSPGASRGHGCRAACIGHSAHHVWPEDKFPDHCHPTPTARGSGERGSVPDGVTRTLRLSASISETQLNGRRHVAMPCPIDGRTSREATTMTSRRELRDVGVQTASLGSPQTHVFPKVSLAGEESGAGTGQTSPVKEVMWDAEGMTWEVYGAAVDPQELGVAIQKHLELQIKEVAASRALKLSQRDTGTSQHRGPGKKRGGLMESLRKPTCCARPSTTED
ncbi:hypothetical protein AAFF_G00381300 [Aldrovandia affinis]|uniref:G protein-regulated inducer of neurite outgrowth C-terminal domain-containing protein n=1 Tax=Aldrovandia affinis TaxID=143900 RepID=A0AAD7T8G5_9TELE|nr:hypothetical protein AAFF_G00381300 [Aldrovandia affinis]